MGISGLLPMLKDVTNRTHLSSYKGKVLGVDAYVWLHRGAYGCAEALATGRATDGYVNYAMAKVRMLQHYGIVPYVVFDGDRLPAKAKTEEDRQRRREESLAKARQLAARGDTAGAREQYVRCVDVTPAMAFQLIKALRSANVQYIVAPYEADAQLAYLERRGVIDGIVSEDSDLLVFGCKVVLYKLRDDGFCDELLYERRRKCKALPLHAFDDDKFRQMAILSGCDYLPSLPKMGIKTACEMLRKYTTVAQILAVVMSRGIIVPPDYKLAFEKAERTFVYQRVFDRSASGEVRVTTLTSLGEEAAGETIDGCIGPAIEASQAHAIANGDLDPISRLPIEDLSAVKRGVEEAGRGTNCRSSFYAQTQSRWMQKRKGVKEASQARLPAGQKKIEGFFTKHAAAVTSQPLRALNGESSTSGTVEGRCRPTEKSRFFTQPVGEVSCKTNVVQIVKESPKKVYEGDANLAAFSTPTQPCKRRRRNSDAQSDDGLISSPHSSTAALDSKPIDRSPSSDIPETCQSSPITSPTTLAIDGSILASTSSEKEHQTPISDGAISSSSLFDRFRFDASSRMMRTPLANIGNKPLARTESDSSAMKAGKRALQVDQPDEDDPFAGSHVTPSALHRSWSSVTPKNANAIGRLSFSTPHGQRSSSTSSNKQRPPSSYRRLTFGS